MNITHTCSSCGEYLELTHDQAVYPDTVAISVTPCKCIAKEIADEIEEYMSKPWPTAYRHLMKNLQAKGLISN